MRTHLATPAVRVLIGKLNHATVMKPTPVTLAGKQWSVLAGTLVVLIGGIFLITLLVETRHREAIDAKPAVSRAP